MHVRFIERSVLLLVVFDPRVFTAAIAVERLTYDRCTKSIVDSSLYKKMMALWLSLVSTAAVGPGVRPASDDQRHFDVAR